jgi:hypothetical protein
MMYQKDSTRRQNIITGNSHHHPPKIFFGARVEASVANKKQRRTAFRDIGASNCQAIIYRPMLN